MYLVEKERKAKKLAKQAKSDEPSDSSHKRSAYLEFLAAMGDISLVDKRVIWRDLSVKERSKY